MKVDIKKIAKNKVEILVDVPALLTESYFKTAAEELSKDLKVKGFRPGKAPIDVVEKEIGSQKLYNEAANIAIQRTLPGILKDEKLEVVGMPEIVIKKIAKGDSMIYQVIFQLMPEVKLSDYKGLKIKKKEIKVEEDELKKSLDYLQNSRAKLVTVNRAAKKGDRIEVDFEIRSKGVKIENGESKNHPLVLGEGRFLPGFEKEIEGLKAGQEKEFSIKAPEDWPDKRIANKKLDFKAKMKLVQERNLPDINDEFAKSLGSFQSLADLKKSVKQGLTQEKEQKEKERIRIELAEKIAEKSEMDIPEALIDEEVEKIINEFKASIVNMGLEFDAYLKEIKKDINELKKDQQTQAKKRVRIGLCLKEIAKKENINISDEEVEAKINEDLKHYPNAEEVKKNIDLNQLKEYTKNILKNEKVFELLEKEAKLI